MVYHFLAMMNGLTREINYLAEDYGELTSVPRERD